MCVKISFVTKRTKRILFYSAVAVFLLLSYVVILYAQGYKYRFSEGKFFRTGAISLKANTDAKVFLDDELKGGTSFFGNSFSIDRLLPGRYKVSVQKDDYSSWQKTVTVEEGLVVDFPQIILLPEEGEEERKLFDEVDLLFKELELSPMSSKSIDPFPLELTGNIKGFRLSENENKLAWWTNNEIWVMWLNDTNYQPFYKNGNKELITRFSQTIQNGAWFRGEDHLVLELESSDSKNRPYSIYKVIEIDKRGGVNIMEL